MAKALQSTQYYVELFRVYYLSICKLYGPLVEIHVQADSYRWGILSTNQLRFSSPVINVDHWCAREFIMGRG